MLWLLIMLGSLGVLGAGAVVVLMARGLLRPPRMTDGKAAYRLQRLSPGDLGLPFEECSFMVRDERSPGRRIRIAGWWIPHARAGGAGGAGGRCVVLVHGYADAKVGAIAWAPLLHSMGLNILAIDLRGHGESGGEAVSAGFFERHDVSRVIDELRTERPGETRQVILFGISLGAAVCAAVGAMRDDLAAVVLESPYADFRSAAMRHATLVGSPGPVFQRAALALAEWMAGARFDEVRPVDLIPKIHAPVLVIHAGDDPLVSDEDAAKLRAAVEGRADFGTTSRFWHVENVGHVLAMAEDPAEYRREVKEFLEKAGVV